MTLADIPILATAIAIVVSWALYALFCSYILEAWVQIKADRGRFMKDYLYLQLMDNVNGINWAEMIYTHGTIDLLSRDPKKPSNDISPKLFAETLVEIVGSAHLVRSGISSFKGPTVGYRSELLRDFKYGTLLLNASDVVSLFRQAINYAELKAKKDAAGNINEEDVHNHLVGYFENWFNEFTQRLTLWYKKKTRERLFYLGILMAVIINVDSLQLFTFYENNPKAKADVIRFYNKHPNLEIGTAVNASKNPLTDTLKSLIEETQLPVGFKHNLFKDKIFQHKAKSNKWEILLKILGVLASGFAASFGAPFWFDVLKKATSKPS
ncbi:hypothetical protein MUK70_15110 [Dyadobacter chenwenxiniae]|uniref:Uncharacterized protein n=1 Tax=Dyadobacter chenwenxiniae TaxID=2906456 RepID=A0A9X1PH78_9BACT|nr:hypothetical protein [Dyadobacter chenwenxiniae]MCF0060571.1 hypothetical protein [Dyadobacter chenwenxiniae]UON86302.1 hypothetical protein MUK70_15110 [Dyadobacter chenwenxiniae]